MNYSSDKILKDKIYFKNKLEPFIYERLKNKKYKLMNLSASNLLTWKRLDLAFRTFYLEYKDKNIELAERIYIEVIRAQTLGTFNEIGNEHKIDPSYFIKSFNETYESIKANGFNMSKGLIPLSKTKTILNGAHRVASAIHLNTSVSCVDTEEHDMIADFKYFNKINVSEEILDTVVLKFLEDTKNTYVAFLWPSGKKNYKLSESKFSNIVYKKKIKLSSRGGFNLLFELYKHMDWIGNQENNYVGIQKKLRECFTEFKEFIIVIFQAKTLEKVRNLKDEVRDINKIGYSSIHITDTKEECIRISRLILNPNGIHFLNFSNPFRSKYLKSQLELFQYFLLKNNIDPQNIVLDSGILLSLYGLREAQDIDYLLDDNLEISMPFENIEQHDEVLKYYQEEKVNLIYDSKNFFYYNGIKFIAFNLLYFMKKNRNEVKDINDTKLMKLLIEKKSIKFKFHKYKQTLVYNKLKFSFLVRNRFILILKKLKLYNLARKIYRFLFFK
jgi:hypothetical protein